MTVQKENGFTGIANELLEQVYKLKLNGTQFKIIMVVWRYTYGFSRKEHNLSVTFISKAIQTDTRTIKRELNNLISMKLIKVVSEATFNKTRVIAFNKNYDTWLITKHHVGNLPPGNKNTTSCSGEFTTSTGGELDTQERNNINKNIKKKNCSSSEELNSFFESIWKLYPNKKGKAKVNIKSKKELQKLGYEKVAAVIDRYKEDLARNPWKQAQNGSTFFNGGYIDYLEQEKVQAEPLEPEPREEIITYDDLPEGAVICPDGTVDYSGVERRW